MKCRHDRLSAVVPQAAADLNHHGIQGHSYEMWIAFINHIDGFLLLLDGNTASSRMFSRLVAGGRKWTQDEITSLKVHTEKLT